ncbi:MAG: selenocysteine-specific translation elongation factor [Deltaproteobacteria bacterium]|jgi:selenocysteine-specific elongation factor|nr:selenocysteine-specific translation elongation factor [Deltaproteobacteria bacterium]
MAKSRHIVIGTAGHVDHGKTSLVLALTGIDADRLAEEKRRGITIVNGYAHFDLGNGEQASIIDVPGHERFIRQMLAGSGAVDLALLVIAADDGVMPQTIEHLHILRLLGVKRAVAVITKCDLAPDQDWLDMLTEDISSLLEGVFELTPPIIKVSVVTHEGLEELTAVLRQAALSVPTKPVQNRFRLPIDRVFTMTGFGTVVTGSLLEGSVEVGQPALLYPSGLEAKIRQVQVHSQVVETAWPGQRTALNLSNLKIEEIKRGDVLATPRSLTPNMMLDATLDILPKSFFRNPWTLKNGSLIKLHLAAKELTAKIVLIDCDRLGPNDRAYVQFRLTEPAVARKGDRFVIRMPSPAMTLGGGEILDGVPLKRRRKPEVTAIFQTKERGDHIDRVELAVRERRGQFEPFSETIKRADLDRSRARNDANLLVEKGVLHFLAADVYLHSCEKKILTGKILSLLAEYHRVNPYSPGASLEEIRVKLLSGANPAVVEAFFQQLIDNKSVVREGGYLRLSSFEPKIDEAGNRQADLLEKAYLDFGFTPLATSAVYPETEPELNRRRKAAFASLVKKGSLIPLDDLYHLHQVHFEKAFKVFTELATSGPVTIAQFRDALKTSRKVALALLDSFDRAGRSFKSGDGRLVRR